ncbi:adenosylmethionine--8-amino-7-oxononanoate transaminase [Galbibacter sp. EGI 63066]|uniref:adenosylmethionine--8-amino-7-oxononanoate transaminase n=1 Tax=Galbibacter sp. EGI 63066 TaxID=2993559 RepID=UPI00224962AB|nr:adenosylmethionine--8-amino-7-oxononanoate transaminase [Galbibacter sp. EGI 63066]MCX2680512.1 adenosylmethionine--8-amino-7-oxononanoate transaminase [Galbibacter sp. EGI 63066]
MTISERDQKHLWHPLTQHKTHPTALGISRAKGALLFDENGKEYIDGIASWYTSAYGHCHDFIVKRVKEQVEILDQVVFSGLTHEPVVKLSEELIKILPENQNKLFFSDNGSTSVEVAIKMSLQYHFNQGEKKNILIAFEEGFHGDTFGAMSVSGLSVYNGPFEDFFLAVERIPVPNGENNEAVLQQLQALISQGNVASFIFEPLVQGAAAMKMHDALGLEMLIEECQKNNVITIADEVMTGFGKTGKYFASQHLEVHPDIMCMSKALTAGMVPMAITSCTEAVYQAFYSDDMGKGLFHGHTYTANPIACAAALAGIELLQSEEMQENIQRVINAHKNFDKRIKNHSKVANTRQCGIIYAFDLDVEMKRYGGLRDRLLNFFLENGLFLRPLGNTIYISAPYVITDEQLQKVYDKIEYLLEEVI